MSTAYPLHHEASGHVAAAPETLFEHLDDPMRLSSHMREKSMAMMGTSMRMETDALGGREPGSVIRMRGRVLGIPIGLEEAVGRHEPPGYKDWEIIGQPRLLVIGPYRMGFRIAPHAQGSMLTVFIDYELPASVPGRVLGRLLGPAYARWCCEQMVRDAQAAFAGGAHTSDAASPAKATAR